MNYKKLHPTILLMTLFCLFTINKSNAQSATVIEPGPEHYASKSLSIGNRTTQITPIKNVTTGNSGQVNQVFNLSRSNSEITTSPAVNCYIPPDGTYTDFPANDDGSIGPITLDFAFSLYGVNYTSVYINNNGNLTFTGPSAVYDPAGFPFNVPMVAPFWADVDTRVGNTVKYKKSLTNLIVTWPGVGYYDRKTNLLNTFQVIITNGNDPLIGLGNNVAFYYGDMQWTTGEVASNGGVGGFGGLPATAGINKGDGINYIQIGRFNANNGTYTGPLSGTSGVNYLDFGCFPLTAGSLTNLPPSVSGNPVNNTLNIACGETGTINLTALPPEVGQNVLVAIDTGSLCNATVTSSSGPSSNAIVSILGAACNEGSHNVSFYFVDNFNPSASTTVNITVVVGSAPVISCPANITVSNTSGQCGGTNVTYPAATATGNLTPTLTYSHASGSFFPIGTTTVTATATNACGSDSCTFTVTVNDTQPPSISCPANIAVSNTPGTCSANVTVPAPTISENCNMVCSTDGLDEYTAGLVSGQSPQWIPWPDLGISATVSSEQAYSMPNSLKFSPVNSGLPVDQVFKLGDQTSGNWVLTFKMFIPTSHAAYYNLQHTQSLYNWAQQVYFNSNGTGGIYLINNGALHSNTSFAYPQNTWFEVKQLIDQTGNITSLYINDIFVKTWPFSISNALPTNQIGALNFAPIANFSSEPNPATTALFYIDDVSLCGAPAPIANYIANRYSKLYPSGTTTNNLKITDLAGNPANCSFTVTVNDTQLPVINCPTPVTANSDIGQCYATNVSLGSSIPVAIINPDFEILYKTGSTSVTSPLFGVGGGTISPSNINMSGPTVTFSDGTSGNAFDLAGWTFNTEMGVTNFNSQFGVGRNMITWMNGATFGGGTAEKTMSQTLGENLLQNTTYTLTADFGWRNDNGVASPPVLRLYAGTTLLTPIASNSPALIQGSFVTYTRTYSVNDNAISGPLRIEFGMAANTDGQQLNTDHVTLNKALAMDNCAIATVIPTLNGNPVTSSTQFLLGSNTVLWTATDTSGNTATCNQTVTVNDTQPPSITCPANIVVSNTPGQCGANVTFAATATDNCGTANLTYSPASDSFFSKGTTTVTATANDGNGNTSSCTFTVTVNDTQPPGITCPAPINVQCPGEVVLVSPIATDNCASIGNALSFDGVNDYLITPNIISLMPTLSMTVELWFKANAAGVIVDELGQTAINTAWHDSQLEILPTGEVKVRVWNMAAVTIGTVSFGTWHHAVVRYNATTSTLDGLLDGVPSGTISGVRERASEQYYAFGALDNTNLGSGGYFNGTIDEIRIWNIARTNAQIQANMNLELNAQANLVASYHLNQGVAGGNNPAVTTALDNSANGLTATLNSFALSGATSNWVGGNVLTGASITNNAPAEFSFGNTTVTWTATDAAGNTTSCNQSVNVVDTQAPVLAPSSTVNNYAYSTATGIALEDLSSGATTVFGTGVDDSSNTVTLPFTFNYMNVGFTALGVSSNGMLNPNSNNANFSNNTNGVVNALFPFWDDLTTGTDGSVKTKVFGTAPNRKFVVEWKDNLFNDGSSLSSTYKVTFQAWLFEGSNVIQYVYGNNIGAVNFSGTVGLKGSTAGDFNEVSPSHTNSTSSINDNYNVWPGSGRSYIFTPSMGCPNNITLSSTPGSCGATATYYASAADNCGTATVSFNPASGSFFAVGTTMVTATANDGHGNTSSCTFSVTVNDTQAPTIACASAVTINNTPGLCTGTTLLTTPTVNDNCIINGNALSLDGSNDRVVLPEFNLGTSDFTIETWIKPSASSNGYIISNRTFEPNQPGNWFVLSRQASGFIAFEMAASGSPSYLPMISNSTVSINVWSHIAVVRSGTVITIYINGVADKIVNDSFVRNLSTGNYSLFGGFPQFNAAWFNGALNETRIWTVARTASQILMNRDTELNAQAGLRALYHFNQGIGGGNNAGLTNVIDSSGNNLNGTLNSFALNGATSNWVAGNALSNVVITNNAPSAFAFGTNTVIWTATDSSGNTATCNQTVTVNDNEPPVINCPANIDADLSAGQCGAFVSYTATASDNCGTANVTYSPASGSLFNVGTTTVTATANDGHGNTSSCTFTVTVDLLDHVNLQWPPDAAICPGGSFRAYGQVYEPNVTTVSGSQGANIEVQFGYSTTNTNPSGWSNWYAASYNSDFNGNPNNDEYYYDFSSNVPGTYFYTFRYRQNGCAWQYGGFKQWDGGTWDGVNNVNGVLTVQSLDWANLQWPPSATICQGSSIIAYGQVYEPGVTTVPGAPGAGIDVQFGYSTTNTNPSGWSNWTALGSANFNAAGGGDSNDEYMYEFYPPSNGTYFYTFRYRLNSCSWQYGGYSSGGGLFWNGSNFISGTVTVDPTSVGGAVSGGTSPICKGFAPAPLTLSGHTGSVLQWESSSDDINWYPIANTSNTLSPGVLLVTTKFRAVVQSGVCLIVYSNPLTITVYQEYPFYADNDSDGYGAGPSVLLCSINATTVPLGYSLDNTDCDDSKGDRHQTYPFYVDADGDTYGAAGSIAIQLCAINASTPPLPNYSVNALDCNDAVFAINPGVYDIPYDSIDNNCDGSLFDGHSPIVVYVLSPSCGGINHGLNNTINCTEIYLGEGYVIGYRFKVTNLVTGEVAYVDTVQHHFKLTDTSIYSYGTPYSIQAAAIVNGEVQPFNGPICTLTTTSVATTKVIASQCGSTLLFMYSTINATAVNSAISYRFRVARANAPGVYYYSPERTSPNFNLTMLTAPAGFLTYATEYKVDVQIKIKLANIIAWSQFGQVCSIFTPAMPDTSLVASQCEMTATSNTQVINTTPYAGATLYRFRLTLYDLIGDLVYSQYVDTPNPYFTLSMFSGLLPNTTYTVSVTMQLYGTFVDYGKDCSVTTPLMAKTTIALPFKAVAHPNPFAENFMIDVTTSSQEMVNLKIYDMLGRLIEQREVKTTDLENSPFGDRYPSGVYNIIVTQGEEVRTVRVVKR
jgi:hypothetical protein